MTIAVDGTSSVSSVYFVAIKANLFAKYGLNVNWLNTSLGASAQVTAFLGGDATFLITGASSEIPAAQAGAAFRAVLQTGTGDPQTICLSPAAAAAHNIPTADKTVADVKKQLNALKGSHLTIATSTITSNSYTWLNALARKLGITIGLNGANPNADLNITTSGSVPNEIAAYMSGKVAGFMNIPPNTLQPGAVDINFGLVPPLTQVVGNYAVTNISTIQQHPDTVQAFTNALVEASLLLKNKPGPSKIMIEDVMAANGASGTQIPTTYGLFKTTIASPLYPTLSSYDHTILTYDISLAVPYSLTYSTFVDQAFVKVAYHHFGIPIP